MNSQSFRVGGSSLTSWAILLAPALFPLVIHSFLLTSLIMNFWLLLKFRTGSSLENKLVLMSLWEYWRCRLQKWLRFCVRECVWALEDYLVEAVFSPSTIGGLKINSGSQAWCLVPLPLLGPKMLYFKDKAFVRIIKNLFWPIHSRPKSMKYQQKNMKV